MKVIRHDTTDIKERRTYIKLIRHNKVDVMVEQTPEMAEANVIKVTTPNGKYGMVNLDGNDIIKVDGYYYCRFFEGNASTYAGATLNFINKYITRDNIVKERPDSKTKAELMAKFEASRRYNIKSAMIKAGDSYLLNGKTVFAPEQTQAVGRYPKITEKVLQNGYIQGPKKIILSKDITEIPDHAYSFSTITEVDFGEAKVTSIGKGAFESTEIKEITIPRTVQRIGSEAFENCRELEKIYFEGPMKFIGMYCFRGCTSLKIVKLPNGIGNLSKRMFANCFNLTKIIIPKTVQHITDDFLADMNKPIFIMPEHLKHEFESTEYYQTHPKVRVQYYKDRY